MCAALYGEREGETCVSRNGRRVEENVTQENRNGRRRRRERKNLEQYEERDKTNEKFLFLPRPLSLSVLFLFSTFKWIIPRWPRHDI